MAKYEYINHTADIMFRANGEDIEEAFSNSAFALTEILCKEKIKSMIKKKFQIQGKDLSNLLYNFLEEFLFLFDKDGILLGEITNIKINKLTEKNYELTCEFFGDKTKNYRIDGDVKAITYHEMIVKEEKGKWITQVVVDV